MSRVIKLLRRIRVFDYVFFFSSRRRHTRLQGDWSSDVCSSDPYFGCNTHAAIGDILPVTCARGTQNSYGWAGGIKLSTGQIVAAVQVYQNIKCRWCGIHDIYSVYDGALVISTDSVDGSGTLGQEIGRA